MQFRKMLCQKMLARRWKMQSRTLESWRCSGKSLKYLKINGGRIRYAIEDIIAFEQQHMKGAK